MQLISVLTQYSKLNRPFTYYYEGDNLLVGIRVLVSFNNRRIVGYVTSVESTAFTLKEASENLGFDLQVIADIVDEKPLLTEELMTLSEFVAAYYLTSQINVLNAMLPPSLKPKLSALKGPGIKRTSLATFNPDFNNFETLKNSDVALLNEIITHGRLQINSKNKAKIERLAANKAIFIQHVEDYRYKAEYLKESEVHELTVQQSEALHKIVTSQKETFLLHGVTGSGKTEVYLALAAQFVNEGKNVIMLVPEIALTGSMFATFHSHFGANIAILHSGLTAAEKYDEYRRIAKGEVQVVVGTRSAIFAPFSSIGAIIIDEEHSSSYKQDSPPFYHALTVAQMRAKSFNAKIVLGSATPSFETMARAQKGVYDYYYLPERINKSPLPATKIVNMLDPKNISRESPYISLPLQSAIKNALDNNTQVILLVNRRGYAPYVSCRHCGEAKRCPTCGITLTYHKEKHIMKCHYCGATFKVNSPCQKCGEIDFLFTGFATQKAEEDVSRLFPSARILRLDSDASKEKSAQSTLDKFAKHEADILIGTQMVAKGHDFSQVSLVGVIGTDRMLSFPSFRSGERTFELITQAIGRSGRADVKGEAIIQTELPNNYVIRYAQKQDYLAFYQAELRNRSLTSSPPYYFLLSILIAHQNEDVIHETIDLLKYNLKEALGSDAFILGPASSFYPASGKKHNETIIIKYRNYFKIKPQLLRVLAPLKEESSLYIHINVDPLDV